MTLLEKVEKKPTRSKGIVALIVATLGTIGIVAYSVYGARNLRAMDVTLLFIILGITAYGTSQTIIRGLLTAVAVYLATAVTSTFYIILTPYARSILNLLGDVGLARPPAQPIDTSALALSFAFAAVVLWVVLESLFRTALPETHVVVLGVLDRIGAALLYLGIGIAVATLIFQVVGYSVAGRQSHNRASLRPEFNQSMDLIRQSQTIWFGGPPPAIYTYD
jgi:hypothetical protein